MSNTTMTSIFITILLAIGLFFGGFNYIQTNYEAAGVVDTTNYNETYSKVVEQQNTLDTNIESVKSSAQGVVEADANIFLVAWNGLTGLAATIRVFFGIISIGVDLWNAIIPGLAFIPDYVKILVELGIIITIVMVIIGLFKGEAKT